MMIIIVKFQFTHPRGVRRGFFCALIFFLSFNSRTREGCDYIFSAAQVHQRVSIHAPARGATVLGFIYLFLRSYNTFFAKYYIVSCFCVYYAYFYSQIIEY